MTNKRVDYVRLFREKDRNDAAIDRWLAAIEKAVTVTSSCRQAIEAGLQRMRPEEFSAYMHEFIDACTGDVFNEAIVDDIHGMLCIDVRFMSFAGELSTIRELIKSDESRTRIAKSFRKHGAISGVESVYVSDLLLEPNALVQLAVTDFVSLRRACSAVRNELLRHLVRNHDNAGDGAGAFEEMDKTFAHSCADLGESSIVIGARLVPIAYLFFEPYDDPSIDEEVDETGGCLVPPEENYGAWLADLIGGNSCIVSHPLPLADAAWTALADLCRLSLEAHRSFTPIPPGGITRIRQNDPLFSLAAGDGSEVVQVHSMLPLLVGPSFEEDLRTIFEGPIRPHDDPALSPPVTH